MSRKETHLARDRAESFGAEAERYDRVRPGYPAALVDDLVATGAHEVLDVGIGTGKAAVLLAARALEVTGVEVDERMAAVARRHGVHVEVAPFESWEDRGRRFDLVVAGQAWHWIDPVSGPRRVAQLLREGGTFAPFWNHRRRPAEPLASDLAEIYARLAPDLGWASMLLGTVDASEELERHRRAIEASGLFEDVEVRSYPWRLTYSPDEWIELLHTQSDHALLAPEARAALVLAVREALEAQVAPIVVEHDAHALFARLAGSPQA